jgi:hypothetical protein
MRIYWGTVAILIAISATNVQAQSLREKEEIAVANKALAEQLEPTNKACETSITASNDWTSILKPEEGRKVSALNYCGGALDAIRLLCRDSPAGKKAVQDQIKSVTCGKSKPRSIEIKDGVVNWKTWDGSPGDSGEFPKEKFPQEKYGWVSDYEFAIGYLKDNL